MVSDTLVQGVVGGTGWFLTGLTGLRGGEERGRRGNHAEGAEGKRGTLIGGKATLTLRPSNNAC